MLGPASIASFIVFVSVLIFVHELGHFLAAKYFNIKVVKFSLGFGPPLLSFRKGETLYQIAALPFGGFVKMVGQSPIDTIDPEDKNRAFTTAPIYQRALIALAGPAFNLLFPILCFFAYNIMGPSVIAPMVGQIELGTPAERAGLQHGDRILAVNGERTWSFDRMSELLGSRPNETLRLDVLRDGKRVELDVTPAPVTREDEFGTPKVRGLIGVSPQRIGTRIGVEDPKKSAGTFQTGDKILTFDGKEVTAADEVGRAIRTAAGRTVDVVVARPAPLEAGDLFLARNEQPKTLRVAVPIAAAGPQDLGLAPADTFIRAVVPGGAADRAGLRPGDRIIGVEGEPVGMFYSFLVAIDRAKGAPVPVRIRRAGAELELAIAADVREKTHPVTLKTRPYFDPGLGMGSPTPDLDTAHWSSAIPPQIERAEISPGEAFFAAIHQTASVIGLLSVMLYKLFNGDVSTDNVGGPMMLFQVAAMAAEIGMLEYLNVLAQISVNIGLINLLPIPIFDGGHLLFCLVEAIKRKPVSVRVHEAASIIGLVLLVALLVLALRNDILRLGIF